MGRFTETLQYQRKRREREGGGGGGGQTDRQTAREML